MMVEAGVLSDASVDRITTRLWPLETPRGEVALGARETLGESDTSSQAPHIADFATKYSARPHMEMLLAAENLVLVSGEREGKRQYILEGSAQQQFRIIVELTLGLGIIFFCVLLYVHGKQDGHQFDCIDGECDSDRLDQELEIAESKKAGSDELEHVDHSPCSSTNEVFINTGALLQVGDSESGTDD